MKTKLWMLGAAVAALTSCTQSEVVEIPESRVIGFDSFVGKNTRVVNELTNDSLKEFHVFGYRILSEDSATAKYSDIPVFTNQKVTKSGTKWTYSPSQYWVTQSSYRFAAYANGYENNTGLTTVELNGQTPSGDYLVCYNPNVDTSVGSADGDQLRFYNYTCDGKTDLVGAISGDRVVGPIVTNTSVPFTFHHMLSRVRFSFAMTTTPNVTMKVEDIYISGAYNKATGICKFVKSDNPNDNVEPEVTWTNVGNNSQNISLEDEEVEITGTTYNYVETLVIPQPNTNLYVHFTLNSYNNADELIEAFPYKAKLHTPNTHNGNWDNGFVYNYIHTFQAEGHDPIQIDFTATVDGWTPAGVNGIELTLEEDD